LILKEKENLLFMKHTRIITAITSQIRLRASLLEDIVNHRTRITRYNYPVTGIERELYCQNIDTISTYSIQTCVKGTLKLDCYNCASVSVETIHVPATSSFIVTCIKGSEEELYKMEFCSSLN
jgi:hypothetical protein